MVDTYKMCLNLAETGKLEYFFEVKYCDLESQFKTKTNFCLTQILFNKCAQNWDSAFVNGLENRMKNTLELKGIKIFAE